MKVALIVEWLDAWRGGAETSTQQFVNHLVDLGVELEVFTRSRVSPRPGMAVQTVPATGLSRSLKTLAFCRRADRMVEGCGCDLIHALVPSRVADVYQPRGGTYAETLRRNRELRTTPLARTLKGVAQRFNLKQRRMLHLERAMLGSAHPPLVLALSDYVVRQLQEHYGLDPARIRKVFNGVDPDLSVATERAAHRREVRALYGIAESDVLALMVAHNFKLKGLRTLIEAASWLQGRERFDGFKVLVVGKDRAAPWRGMVLRKNLDECVQFAGATLRPRAFFHAADMLVHPTYYDPCSRVVLEALSSGLPPITTRFDGASEVVQDGVNGFVLEEAGDARGLAERMDALREPALRRTMAEAARSCASASDMGRHAAEVVQVYQSVIAQKAKK